MWKDPNVDSGMRSCDYELCSDCDYDKDDLQVSTMTMFDGLRSEHKARDDTRHPCIR